MAAAPDRNQQLTQLLAQVALADQRAFAKLYELTSGKLFGIALRMLRRRDWAEEVLQECYVSIWHHAADYTAAKAAPLTWLVTIVRNRSLDWLRRPRVEDTVDDEQLFESIADESGGPLEQLMEQSESLKLYHCLQRLGSSERQCITLAFLQGLSHSELAQHLRQPLGTIKSHIRRGLQRLKACIDL